MTKKKDIMILHKKQLRLKIDAIRLAINHNAVKGVEAEFAFKQLLRKYLPQKYKLLSGFVMNGGNISNQHDIIIYDDSINVPMYLGNYSGLFIGGAVYGILETTITKLSKSKLEGDIIKIANLRKLFNKDKVAFQKVISCPILNENELKSGVESRLSSGYCIDDVWSEIKKKCISKEGAFIGDPFKLESVGEYEREVNT